MGKLEQDAFNFILRSDSHAFLHRCFLTLNPGTPFLRNWHISANPLPARANPEWGDQPAYYQHAATISEIDHLLRRIPSLLTGS